MFKFKNSLFTNLSTAVAAQGQRATAPLGQQAASYQSWCLREQVVALVAAEQDTGRHLEAHTSTKSGGAVQLD